MTFLSCGKKEQIDSSASTGSIVFVANGEDFVRENFVDKQGWSIGFDNLYVNIVDPIAYGEPGEAVASFPFGPSECGDDDENGYKDREEC